MKFHHKKKQKILNEQIKDMKNKTACDQKKHVISDFFHSKSSTSPPTPPIHISLLDELESDLEHDL